MLIGIPSFVERQCLLKQKITLKPCTLDIRLSKVINLALKSLRCVSY